jgi:hypothetical protein
MAVGDLDGDGLPDVVLGSRQSGAVVLFQAEPRTFETARRLRAPGRFVCIVDWDGDGRSEILATATRERVETLTCIEVDTDRTLRARWSVPLSAGARETPRLADWDDDGDVDLLWVSDDFAHVHVLLNNGAGGVGAQRRVPLGKAIDWAPLAEAGEVLVAALERSSGIVRLLRPGADESRDSATAFGDPFIVAFPDQDSADRIPLVVSPAGRGEAAALCLPLRPAAEALVLRFDRAGELQRSRVPTLREVDAAQWLDDGRLFLLSRSEGTVALAPSPGSGATPLDLIPLNLEPLAGAVGRFGDAAEPRLFVMGRDESNALKIAALSLDTSDDASPEMQSFPGLPNEDPTALGAGDLDGDGRDEMLIFYSYRAPLIASRGDDGAWRAVSETHRVPASFFEGVGVNQLWLGDLESDDAPDLLLARGDLIRLLHFSRGPEVEVRAQINAPRPGMAFAAVVGVPGNAEHPPQILALEREESLVLVYERNDAGEWTLETEVDLDLPLPQRLAAGDWNGDGRGDIAVKASGALALAFGGRETPPLEQLATLESPLEEGRLGLIETASWDGDVPYLHAVDHRHHVLLIWRWDGYAQEWTDVFRFPVFETPLEQRRDWEVDLERINVEPRELAVDDVDGDGRDDLVLLAHENVLVYTRVEEPGD